MDDELPEAQWSGDPVIAEEARRLKAQEQRKALEDLLAQRHQQARREHRQAQESRRRGCLLWLAVGLAIAGPFFAVLSLMGGGEAVLPITAGSCGLAGLTFAAVSHGIRGALIALAFPLIWLVVAAWPLVFSNGPPDATAAEMTFYLVGFVLIQAASIEAGYLVGRLIAGLIRRPGSAASAR